MKFVLIVSLVLLPAIFALGTQLSNQQKNCVTTDLQTLDCGWYLDCVEDNFHCGPKGYPVGYGHKYCTRFMENISQFNEKGQEWIRGTLKCLKRELSTSLVESYQGNNKLTCKIINDRAFDSHPQCYIENGFCTVFDQDGLKTLKELIFVYDIRDFLSFKANEQILKVLAGCVF